MIEVMYRKRLWKIESLWDSLVIHPSHFRMQDIQHLYRNNTSIYNPDFHTVEVFDFRKSEKPAHRDDYGEYFGLRNSQVLEKDGKLVYLFDNHNKIIQAFLEYAETTGKAFDVVHIDAHNDDAVFAKQKPHHLELKKVREYIAQTRISDFFDFLSKAVVPISHIVIASGEERNEVISKRQIKQEIPEIASQARDDKENTLIQNIHRYTKSTDFKTFKKPQNSHMLSLDIDIFGPEGDFIDLESKIYIIAEAWRDAEVICIAMSPGFIDQTFARKLVEIFTKKSF